MLFLLDLGILGIAVFGIEARIPGNESKSHKPEGEIPSTSHYPMWITILVHPPVSVFGKAKSLDLSIADGI